MIKDDVPLGEHLVPLGQARTVRDGSDIVIIAWSYMVDVARRAAEQLAADGVDARVLDLRTLVPLDVDAIVSKWDLVYRRPTAELVDVTELLVDAMQPDARGRKSALEILAQPPIPEDELDHDH